MRVDAVPVDFEKLAAFFRRDRNVCFSTVFGSSVDGTVAVGSDLDIAVLFRQSPAPGEDYLRYYSRLCDVIPEVECVDVVNLNTADPILAFEALRGRVLSKNDPDETAAFTSRICREYEDVIGYLAHLRRQLAAGR